MTFFICAFNTFTYLLINDVSACCSRLQIQLLPATSATCGEAITVEWDDKDLCSLVVSGRLDYCNILLAGISDGLIQSVQKAAARLVRGLWKFDHISETLRKLHWLPVRKRITYKVTLGLLVFKCLNGLAPMYLADDCRFMSSLSDRRHLRSSTSGVLYTSRGRARVLGFEASLWLDQLLGTICHSNSANDSNFNQDTCWSAWWPVLYREQDSLLLVLL